jgi:small subunit ribosomal protein S6
MPTKTGKRSYELTYLVPATLTDADITKIKESVATLVKKHQGEIVTTDEWGKRRLAYRIKHGGAVHADAHYVHLVISFPTDKVALFEKDIYLMTTLLRHLLVVGEEKEEVAAK